MLATFRLLNLIEWGVKMKKDRCYIKQGLSHGPSAIPQEGKWTYAKEIKDICGFAHGCGTCAPQMGTCKLTLNIKSGIIKEALVEVIGCSGMTQSAAMAAEILSGKTLLEALNTDLVCDAINSAMKALFIQIVYGRTQSSFSDDGLPIGGAWEDLGSTTCSQVGTSYSNVECGPRYLNITGGYVTSMALDKNNEIIGYKMIQVGKFMKNVRCGKDIKIAYDDATETYGRYSEGMKFIDPRDE